MWPNAHIATPTSGNYREVILTSFSELRAVAQETDVHKFAAVVPCPVLLKRPFVATAPPEDPSAGFFTQIGARVLNPEFASAWLAYRVEKRADSPFRSRISIGRARNCDVVLRVPQISKLHAHITMEGGSFILVDNGSSNGTAVDEQQSPPGEQVVLSSKAKVTLGGVDFEFLLPPDAWAVLRAAPPAK